jgi:hypothetical protein
MLGSVVIREVIGEAGGIILAYNNHPNRVADVVWAYFL